MILKKRKLTLFLFAWQNENSNRKGEYRYGNEKS